MLTTESLQFLYEINQNNNRDWFEKTKAAGYFQAGQALNTFFRNAIGKP